MSTVIFTRAIRDAAGNLVDADQQPTIGIVRTDTGAVVVAAGAPMAGGSGQGSLGRYSYTVADAIDGVAYRATYTILVDGETVTSVSTKTAGSSPTAAAMVAKIKLALLTGDALVTMVNADGQQVNWSRKQALDELVFWQREAAKEAKTRPRASRIRLDRW